MKKERLVVVTIFLIGLLACLEFSSSAFEIFPRPRDQYTVQRGSTLYGIAGQYYTNPSLWPLLWNQNPSVYITPNVNSPENHPLVPGTKINLFDKPFPFQALNQEYHPPTGIPDDVRFLIRTIPYTGVPYDKKYFKFKLSRRPTRLWGYIVASPATYKDHYLERDLVYIRFRPSKRQCVMVGDRFGIYRERGPLRHPLNPQVHTGYLSEIIGEVEIISTSHNMVTGIILDSYAGIVRGDKVCLFIPRSREIVPSKTHRMLTGTILASATRDVFYTETNNLENDIVFIDRGSCDGLKEGLLVNIYRPSRPVKDPFRARYISVPDRYVGEGMVLKAFDKNSTLIITQSREEVVPGDIIKSVSD